MVSGIQQRPKRVVSRKNLTICADEVLLKRGETMTEKKNVRARRTRVDNILMITALLGILDLDAACAQEVLRCLHLVSGFEETDEMVVYHALNRLVSLHLATSRKVLEHGNKRPVSRYRITPLGQKKLQEGRRCLEDVLRFCNRK